MAHSVFISYSSQDKKVADAVCATLENRKIRCWIAPRDVLSGLPYAEALIDAIKQSSIMVLVFSASSNDSPQVMREVERAVDKGIPIIPFRIENVLPSKAMEYYLSAPHWLDAVTPPLEKHLKKLADTVEALLVEIEKPHTERDEKEEVTTKPETKATTGKRRTGLWVTAGIVVAALIIVVIVLATGGFGGGDEDTDGLVSGPTPGETTTPTTAPTTTSASTSPATTTQPPTSTTAPPATTTTTSGSTNGSNGTSQTAIPLEAGVSIQSELTFTGEVHWYTFDAMEGDAVYIVLTEAENDSPFYPWLGLLAPDGSIVYENYYSESVQIDRWIAQNGTYTVRVRDHNLGTGSYVLSFCQLSKANNPVSPGSIQGQLEFPGEVHWYTFEGKEGDAVYIVLTEGEKGGQFYPWLGLLAPDGSIVYENYYSDSVQIDRSLPATGTYIIRVRDHNLVGGTYTLSFSMLSN